MRRIFPLQGVLLCLILAACSRAASVSTPAPVPTPGTGGSPPAALPPITPVDGPLELRVVYPAPNALIASRDSNFIFGSTGSGLASVEINGTPVKVHPNGAFIAFIPIPPAESPQYELRASRGADTAVLVHPVRLLPPPVVLADTGPLVVDSASVQPRARMQLRPGERVRVSVRAPANASVVAAWKGGSQPLVVRGASLLADSLAPPVTLGRDPLRWTAELPASALADSAALVISRGADTVRLPITVAEIDTTSSARLVMLGASALAAGDAERAVVGRSVPDPAGTSRWFLHPGTIVQATGRSGAYTRIRLDGTLEIWVETVDVAPLRSGVMAPRPVLLSARIAPADGWADLVLPLGEPVPFLVEEGERSLVMTLYGVKVSVDAIAFPRNDSLIRTVRATQVANDRAEVRVNFDGAAFGYQTLWENGRLILRVRRTPVVDRAMPLRGLVIAVDPGHPPIGATGPTGLYEGDAVLEIGGRLRAMLEERGATVVMTRTTPDPVPLGDRPIIARRANAHAFVSIHLNAYPDGVNPFVASGTGTYFFFQNSERLARAVQRGMLAEMGLLDVGVFQQSFAVVRNSWMPSVLAEGAFLMIPEQEAALRTPAFQDAYARGVVDGLESYFRSLGSAP